VDPGVREEILALFRDRTAVSWEIGGLFGYRDRTSVPLKRLGTGGSGAGQSSLPPDADTWRIVPGGTSVRAGVRLGRGVTILPPSFVNVGAWIGEQSMIDSHVLVGSCAQVGARVHLSAGVQIGGVLEPPNARPVIVEDDAFVGAQCGLFDGVLVGRRAVLGAGVLLTGTSRLYDLVRGCVHQGSATAPLEVPAEAVVIAGARRLEGDLAEAHGLAAATALIVKYRDAGTDARVALEGALR
jgi:2,3,4,5-tetrahydropyridine-2-carboxylate N-succinyltransferase